MLKDSDQGSQIWKHLRILEELPKNPPTFNKIIKTTKMKCTGMRTIF